MKVQMAVISNADKEGRNLDMVIVVQGDTGKPKLVAVVDRHFLTAGPIILQ